MSFYFYICFVRRGESFFRLEDASSVKVTSQSSDPGYWEFKLKSILLDGGLGPETPVFYLFKVGVLMSDQRSYGTCKNV